MHDRELDERSFRFTERVDALGNALHDAGVPPEAASRLLEAAATAALHALTLELLLAPVPPVAAAAAEELPAAPPAEVAAAA